jgi:hypothetical protein
MSKVVRVRVEGFSLQEAQAKLGKSVCLLTDYDQFPKGAIGDVVDIHEPVKGNFEIVVRFERSNVPEPIHRSVSRKRFNNLFSEC